MGVAHQGVYGGGGRVGELFRGLAVRRQVVHTHGARLEDLVEEGLSSAQLGDPNEPPYVPPADPRCPVCGASMTEHRIDRGGPGKPTLLNCPPPTPEA